ncbi:MAG: 1-deoxy-D-xylulose-5-phosphate synthase, partial [Chlamydiae bacterium]|nr:1-deoxy-D-xylulose-5-phosphate synthase [Chlamydiota bacterium]
HGVKPFDPKTCKFHPNPSKKPTFPKLFGKQLVKMGERDKTVTVVTPAMSLGSGLDPFFEKFPKRAIDVGIAEGHCVTFCGGMAKYHDRKVFCSIYATFLHRAMDNLFHDVCLQRVPVIFAIDRAGLATGDGATHHGIYDIAFLRAMPGMAICQPRNGQLLRDLVESAPLWNRACAIRYPNMATEEGGIATNFRPLGRGELLETGEDLLIISLGHCCTLAYELRELLAQKKVSCTIVDPIFVKPLDVTLLGKLLLEHRRVVTIEEHSLKGGLAPEVGQFLHEHQFGDTELLSFGIPDQFYEHGSHRALLERVGMLPKQMMKRIQTHFSLGVGHDRGTVCQ